MDSAGQSVTNLKVQQLTLSLLQIFIDICEKHKLRYYFTGGALIGVKRHKGFIPWDDDIDIGMPRKDYERFLELLKLEPVNGYGICNRYTDKKWHFAMSQFIDERSEIEIDLAEQKRLAHIWVDVFPLDGLPKNAVLRWLRVKHILCIRYLIQIAHIESQVDSHRSRPWYEKAVLKFFKVMPIGKLLNTDKLLDKLERVLVKSDFYNSVYAGNMLGRYREKEVVLQEWFGTPKKAVFEGIDVNVPADSHNILQALYGDYMKLPPEKDRVAHNVRILRSREDSYVERGRIQ